MLVLSIYKIHVAIYLIIYQLQSLTQTDSFSMFPITPLKYYLYWK